MVYIVQTRSLLYVDFHSHNNLELAAPFGDDYCGAISGS